MTYLNERGMGRTLPPPTQPQDVARAVVGEYPGGLTWWRGDFYTWTGTHWALEADERVETWVRNLTEAAIYVAMNAKGEPENKPWAPNNRKVADLMRAISVGVLNRPGEDYRGLVLSNGVLEDGALLPHTPDRFNLTSLPFAYDPTAEPRAWLSFLDSSLPGDETAHAFLQEWFGYVLSGRTDIQMMASLVGASRSGKSTIVRVLEAMIGRDNATGVSLADLGSQFGKAGLIGKTLATIAEPNWASRAAGEVVEPILKITGGETMEVDRKYTQPWRGRLGVRFMILSNETPRLVNRSGALANRMTHVRFNVSFAGREDYGLEPRLLGELPGILNWALDGLKRLEANGRFTVPDSHADVDAKFREYADADATFLDRMCVLGPDLRATEDEMYEAYQAWCLKAGRKNDSTTAMTLRHRLTERPGITAKRVGKAKVWTLFGATVPQHAQPFDED